MFKMFSTITLLGLAAMPAAYAQSAQPIEAKVPFAFVVQNTTLSPGHYRLTYNNTAHLLSVRGLDENAGAAMVTAAPADAAGSASRSPKLLFQCYEKTCYLAQVWQGAIGGDRSLHVHPVPQQRRLSFATRAVSITIPAQSR